MRQLKSRAISRKVQAQYADIVLESYKEKKAKAKKPRALNKDEFVKAMLKDKEDADG